MIQRSLMILTTLGVFFIPENGECPSRSGQAPKLSVLLDRVLRQRLAPPTHYPPHAAPSEYSLHSTHHSEDELIRRNNLNAESNIKGIGLLYFLGEILTLVSLLTTNRKASRLSPGSVEHTGYLIGTALVSLTFLIVSDGLRELNTLARIITGILSAFALLGFPIGTVISIFFF